MHIHKVETGRLYDQTIQVTGVFKSKRGSFDQTTETVIEKFLEHRGGYKEFLVLGKKCFRRLTVDLVEGNWVLIVTFEATGSVGTSHRRLVCFDRADIAEVKKEASTIIAALKGLLEPFDDDER